MERRAIGKAVCRWGAHLQAAPGGVPARLLRRTITDGHAVTDAAITGGHAVTDAAGDYRWARGYRRGERDRVVLTLA